ncbi:MAG: exodeoxyribonuclease VII small subunit [Lachnospira sp.]|nr:exodeoxyribonuclease VII small subunit [Lachnospira sp.]MDD5829085.1 exodeoxyribonuclease VII small subunit [Lachnospira sp.]
MAKNLTLEQSFDKLEEIIGMMENGNISLDESFKLYKEGVKLVGNCNKQLDKVEKQIIVVNSDGEQEETDEEF